MCLKPGDFESYSDPDNICFLQLRVSKSAMSWCHGRGSMSIGISTLLLTKVGTTFNPVVLRKTPLLGSPATCAQALSVFLRVQSFNSHPVCMSRSVGKPSRAKQGVQAIYSPEHGYSYIYEISKDSQTISRPPHARKRSSFPACQHRNRRSTTWPGLNAG